MMNIYQKLIAIKKEIKFFTKDTKGYNYQYVSGNQVLAMIKDKMDELGVILEPHVSHRETRTYECIVGAVGKEKKVSNYIIDAPMTYQWVNTDNPEDRAICEWSLYGVQEDPSKAFGSALTYSERYFLLKYFGVPTDELDPDFLKKGKKEKDKSPEEIAKENEEAEKSKTLDSIKKEIDTVAKRISALPKIVTDTNEELKNPKIIKMIEVIKSNVKTPDGKPAANYNILQDVEVAKILLAELKKLEGANL
jgi:hypothetical protein